jgi:hypothetical protein
MHCGSSYEMYIHVVFMELTTFLVSWDGVRLSPLGKSATIWSTVPAPDDG